MPNQLPSQEHLSRGNQEANILITSYSSIKRNYSSNEVHNNKVQNGAGKKKISKGSFWGDALEIRFVLWVDLYSQANREDEAPHAGDEARQERVEGKGPHEKTVTELQRPGQQYIQEVRIQQLQTLRSGAQILF